MTLSHKVFRSYAFGLRRHSQFYARERIGALRSRRLQSSTSSERTGKKTSIDLSRSPRNSSSNNNNNDLVAEQEALDFLLQRGRALGYRLTLSERKLIYAELSSALKKKIGGNNKLLLKQEWEKLVSRRYLAEQERRTLSFFLGKSHDGSLTQRYLLKNTARLGIAFFAITGAHTAGEAGMHVLGSTLVGCITALGGGTLNNLITGVIPVGWVADPSFLFITVAASLVGYYGWPLLERTLSDDEEKDNHHASSNDCSNPMEKNNSSPSVPRYAMESVALGSLAVVGAQQGIIRGLHPVISATMGVTVAFGGVLRDLMCKRDLSLGAATGCQSYGLASFSGAAVYVALREIHVWNCAGSAKKLVAGGIPLGVRILLGFGTVFGIRAAAWHYKPDGILLTMPESAEANHKRLQELGSYFWRP